MPRKKRSDAFAKFWMHVRNEELVILDNEHRGRVPPDCLSDPWNESFETAYLEIRHFLKKYRSLRSFYIPPGIMALSVPIQAENAHQALMYFLNPGKNLSGEVGVLDSLQYIEIKSMAMEEEKQLDVASAVPKSANIKKELADLASNIIEAATLGRPLKKRELAARMGWDLNRVGRRMERFFGEQPFTNGYADIFKSKEPRKGIMDFLKNGFYNVDAAVVDPEYVEDDEIDSFD